MKKLLIFLMLFLLPLCPAYAMNYADNGVSIDFPDGWQLVEPKAPHVMMAGNPANGSNANLTIAPYDGPTYTQEQVNAAGAAMLEELNKQPDTKMSGGNVVQLGDNIGLELYGNMKASDTLLDVLMYCMFVDGKCYTLTLICTDNDLDAVRKAGLSIKLTK